MTISQYPLGPLILLVEYTTHSKEEVRILLPGHIFKTMRVEERRDFLKDPTTLIVKPERKVAKDLNDLRSYFNGVHLRDGALRVSLNQDHTNSCLYADISGKQEGFEISYEHISGNKDITEYFMKTLVFLLSK